MEFAHFGTSRPEELNIQVMEDNSRLENANLRIWKFNVYAPEVAQSEAVCVSGDCESLGQWQYDKVLFLKKESESRCWSSECSIPLNCDVTFRYCVCSVLSEPLKIIVRRWETHVVPRKIKAGLTALPEGPDIFGEYNGRYKVDKGWLTYGSIVQFKFHSSPFTFKSNWKDGTLSIKVTPVISQFHSENSHVVLSEDSFNTDTIDSELPNCIITEVATLNHPDSIFKPVEQFGHIYNSNDFLIFNIFIPNHDALTYLVDFYKYSSRIFYNEPPSHIGYTYILPSVLKRSEGQLELPIISTTKHRPFGMMNVEFLVIRPMREPICDLKQSYTNHWSESWTGLDVGHRGLGSSFKAKESTSIRENTIASLKTAAANGADMLEFDVQLSKDHIPVIYHDFLVCIALKKKKQIDYNEMLEIPVKDLTVDQLHKLKVYHVVEGRSNEQRFFDEDFDEHQPFPLLSEALEVIDPNVGFNIEIKWILKLEDGTTEIQSSIDINLYIDKILEVVLQCTVPRRIVFSCFHPDVCAMIRLKQNIYPTMFLTQGITDKYPRLHDIRCNSIPAAVSHALNANLLGIVVHTEDLLRDSTQVKLVIDAGLIIFCWGDDNNSKETIEHLKKLGLHAVIFDKLDQFSTKEIKESIFLMEAREAQKELINVTTSNSHHDINFQDKIFPSPSEQNTK